MTPVNDIELKPAYIWAFLKCFPLLLLAVTFLLLAWWLSHYFILFSLAVTGAAWYRMLYLRSYTFQITHELIRLQHGIFNKRSDLVEMFRIKDYVITQSFLQQLFKIMNVTLKTTDPENYSVDMFGIPESDIIDTIRERVQQARQDNHIYEIN
ncbi:PH domain-containing protein [Mucilaginibacter phyllosphaerae]